MKENPERIKAQAKRNRARTWLKIISSGIAEALKESVWPEDIREVVKVVNGELLEAIIAAEEAEEAYKPWRRLRRVRIIRGRPKNPRPKKKV